MKQIELLLLDNVSNLGIVGDVVQVKPGYARNYLIPRGLATVPTPGAVDRLKERRAQVAEEMRQLREQQEQLIERLSEVELTLERSANEQGVLFGGVSQHDIAEALREAGYDIEDRWVRIGEQIKRLDSYEIPIVVDKELKTEIKLWVVSDRPLEEIAGTEEAEQAEAERAEAEEAEAPAEANEAPEQA